jgi:hypothetical protein
VISEPSGGWQVKYAGDLGELEMRIYFEEHLGDASFAARASAGWDGDAYAVLSREADLGLVWYTVWDSEADADEFADAYRTAFIARFGGEGAGARLVGEGRQTRVDRLTVQGMPFVRVLETGTGVELDDPPEVHLDTKGG